MHPLFLLAFATFVLVVAFLVWSLLSTRRHRFDRNQTGIGGPNDPLSGAGHEMRDPGTMTAAIDNASVTPLAERERKTVE